MTSKNRHNDFTKRQGQRHKDETAFTNEITTFFKEIVIECMYEQKDEKNPTWNEVLDFAQFYFTIPDEPGKDTALVFTDMDSDSRLVFNTLWPLFVEAEKKYTYGKGKKIPVFDENKKYDMKTYRYSDYLIILQENRIAKLEAEITRLKGLLS